MRSAQADSHERARRSREVACLPLDSGASCYGLEHRGPHALRHTYASMAIASGVPPFELARFNGPSVATLDRTYGHLLPDALVVLVLPWTCSWRASRASQASA